MLILMKASKGAAKKHLISAETRRKLSEATKKMWQNKAVRQKIILAQRRGEERKCLYCGKVFYVPLNRLKSGRGKFCSRECWARGHKISPETRRKISVANVGKRLSDEAKRKDSEAHKGQVPWNKGKKMPPMSRETREKMRKSRLGEKSALWKGGKMKEYPLLIQIRKSSDYNKWRKAIFERDNYTCQKCGKRGGELEAHHIFNFADFPSLRIEISNGVTLCRKCHKDFHKRYGKNNNTKEQLEEFLKNDKQK